MVMCLDTFPAGKQFKRVHNMTHSTDISPAELVRAAITRFSAGDDDGFVACFHPDATVWADPQLSPSVVLSGCDEIAAWCREARSRWSDVAFSHGELSNQGAGAYVELDIVTTSRGAGGAWRLSIAVFVRDGRVLEVLPQPDREAAIGVLATQ
jgi:ketosteroid isomerase-like protein